MASASPRILIAEDDASLAGQLEALLSQRGYPVDRAADGNEALSKIRSTPPNLLILDALLPKVSGFQVARLVKFDPNLKKLPILMLTILDQPADKERGKGVGVDLYLTKPFSEEDLLAAVKKLAGG